VFSQFDGKRSPGFQIEALRDHSLAVASLARHIARSMGLPKAAVDDAFAGGLMHDLGKLVLGSNFPEQYREVMNEQDPRAARETEARIFGSDHCAVGAYLLWLWGLPESVTEIVACHHLGEEHWPRSPVMAVYLADSLLRGGAKWERAQLHVERVGLTLSAPDWEQWALELSEKALKC
jgi:putative nucleotidyltransferase with HDIG domain